jgi:D-lactate dehydrogenase
LQADFQYDGLDTCAVDGLCATACPVDINTGDLVKHLRADGASEREQSIALWAAEHFATVERAVGLGVRMGHLAERIIGVEALAGVSRIGERISGLTLPKWNRGVPRSGGSLPSTQAEGAAAVYFPACLSRQMGRPPGKDAAPVLAEVFLSVAGRAGVGLWIPPDCTGLCCGMPFGSKGHTKAYAEMLHRTITHLWAWSGNGRLPVVIDASSCAYTLRTCSGALTAEDRRQWAGLKIYDPVEYIAAELLPRLQSAGKIRQLPRKIALHPNCALRKLGGVAGMERIASACAETVYTPVNLECCATAGDRGLLFPELTESASRPEIAELEQSEWDGYYSSNLTCEMGLAAASGLPYRSILYLLEEATRL